MEHREGWALDQSINQ